MKKSIIYTLIAIIAICKINYADGQELNTSTKGFYSNSINAYAGIFDLNLNYERTLGHLPKSFTNLRLGFGKGGFYIAGEGNYVNASLVHIMGTHNSHLEVDLGFKYMVTNSIEHPGFSDTFLPEIFVGYRYEKPRGRMIYRIGGNYLTGLNLGIGYKF